MPRCSPRKPKPWPRAFWTKRWRAAPRSSRHSRAASWCYRTRSPGCNSASRTRRCAMSRCSMTCAPRAARRRFQNSICSPPTSRCVRRRRAPVSDWRMRRSSISPNSNARRSSRCCSAGCATRTRGNRCAISPLFSSACNCTPVCRRLSNFFGLRAACWRGWPRTGWRRPSNARSCCHDSTS